MAFPDTPLIAKVLKRHLCEWRAKAVFVLLVLTFRPTIDARRMEGADADGGSWLLSVTR